MNGKELASSAENLAQQSALEADVRHLAALDRGSATSGEHEAAQWLAQRLRALGADARVEAEPAHGGYWWPIGLLNALAAPGAGPRPAVVGFDNSPVAGWPVFSLTTVDAHLQQLARRAVGLLVERLAGDPDLPPRKVVLPTNLVLRGSHVVA